MEGKYVKKQAELKVAMNARKCEVSEGGIADELKNIDCLSEKGLNSLSVIKSSS